MKYKFPEIKTIDDVLPHIKDRDEFIVAERDHYTVINYVVAMQDTFHMDGPDDLRGAIRRECRGLIFDLGGYIISRPFHKFFNLGERAETFPNMIKTDEITHIEAKLDGSMVRPFFVDNKLRWGTKMGVTDGFSDRIEEFVSKNPIYTQVALAYLKEGYTPIFEWYGPQNRIVVNYEKEDMKLLAARKMVTGQYIDVHKGDIIVPKYPSVKNVDEFIANTRGEKGIEGYIIVFQDGHRVKLKTDEYVRIHKTKDEIRFDFYIAQHILNEELDDVKPFLDESDLKRVEEYEKKFWDHFNYHENRIIGIWQQTPGWDRKVVATTILKDEDSWTKSLVFKMMDGKSIRESLLDHFKKNVNGQTSHKKLMDWK